MAKEKISIEKNKEGIKSEKEKIIESIVKEACWNIRDLSGYDGYPTDNREVTPDQAEEIRTIIKEATEKLRELF